LAYQIAAFVVLLVLDFSCMEVYLYMQWLNLKETEVHNSAKKFLANMYVQKWSTLLTFLDRPLNPGTVKFASHLMCVIYVSVCMYVCIMYVCICVYVCLYVMYVLVYVFMPVYICAYVFMRACIHVYIYLHVYVYKSIYVLMHVRMVFNRLHAFPRNVMYT
jgi:hypothetical protein